MRVTVVPLIVVLLASCNLEGNYPMDVRFPHQIEVKNGNSTKIDIKKIVGDPAIETMFVITGEKLSANESFTFKVNDDTAAAFINSTFSITAKCDKGEEWRKPATEVATISSNSEPPPHILITIAGCD